MSGDDVSCGIPSLGKGEEVLTATSGDSGDVEREGLFSLRRVDGILRGMGGDVVDGGERPRLDVGHGLRQAERREEGKEGAKVATLELKMQMKMLMMSSKGE